MGYLEAATYSPLPAEDQTDVKGPLLAEEGITPGVNSKGRRFSNRAILLVVSIQTTLLVLCGSAAFFLGRHTVPSHLGLSCIDTPWNDLRSKAVELETQTFSGHFEDKSEYQGSPNRNLDAKWNQITALYNFGVDIDTLHKANKTRGLVQWPGTSQYMVGIEVFHQLHCLNYIRMYTYMDYYEGINADMLQEPIEERTNHKGHILRI
ncbi:hypothetical protein HGRIS_007867 [Hohenbuehelia grisea]|uniref:Cyclochlorotine biosynthesis protein O n=1 Tax=Hohenbuehelia grisea TaxID=104357 RepID=A0ABR3J6Y3_9AGAR